MTVWRRWVVVGMVSALFLGVAVPGDCVAKTVSGRETNESAAKAYFRQSMDRLEQSSEIQADASLGLKLAVLGLEVAGEAKLSLVSMQESKATSTASGRKIYAQMSADMGILGTAQATTYGYMTGEGTVLYEKEDNNWHSRTVDSGEFARYDGQQMVLTLMEQIEEPTLLGQVALESGKAYLYKGIISKKGLGKVLVDSGFVGLLAEGFGNSALRPVGEMLGREDDIRALAAKAEDLPVYLWIDKQSGYPVQCAMDVGKMFNDALGKLRTAGNEQNTQNQSGSSAGKRTIWSWVEVTQAQIVIQCKGTRQ